MLILPGYVLILSLRVVISVLPVGVPGLRLPVNIRLIVIIPVHLRPVLNPRLYTRAIYVQRVVINHCSAGT